MSKGKIIWKLVWQIIWWVFAAALWTVGLILFLQTIKNYEGQADADKWIGYLTGWAIWGGLCAVATLRDSLANVFGQASKQGRKGAIRGANDYTVTDNGSSYTVENHPMRGGILGFIGGLIGGVIGTVVAGPISIPLKLIRKITTIVKTGKQLKTAN